MAEVVLNGLTENGKWCNILGIWCNDYRLTAHQATHIVIM